MIIDFTKLIMQIIDNFKGGNLQTVMQTFEDDKNRILKGLLIPGASIGVHTHDTNSEIIYILSGNATIIFNDTTEQLSEGQCHYCPKGNTHSMTNNSDKDLEFIAIITQQ